MVSLILKPFSARSGQQCQILTKIPNFICEMGKTKSTLLSILCEFKAGDKLAFVTGFLRAKGFNTI